MTGAVCLCAATVVDCVGRHTIATPSEIGCNSSTGSSVVEVMRLTSAEQALAGAVPTLDALYEREHAAMVRLAHLLTGSLATAEDVVHDAFIRVAPRLATLERPGAYLRTAVINGCRTYHRRTATARQKAAALRVPDSYLPGHLVEFFDALHHLPPRQRTAVVLRYYADLPDEQIAVHLGCRRSTVRVLVHRALTHLREVIEP